MDAVSDQRKLLRSQVRAVGHAVVETDGVAAAAAAAAVAAAAPPAARCAAAAEGRGGAAAEGGLEEATPRVPDLAVSGDVLEAQDDADCAVSVDLAPHVGTLDTPEPPADLLQRRGVSLRRGLKTKGNSKGQMAKA